MLRIHTELFILFKMRIHQIPTKIFEETIEPFKHFSLVGGNGRDKPCIKPKTVKEIISLVRGLCKAMEQNQIKKICENDIVVYLRYMHEKKGWEQGTYYNKRAYLRTYFKWALESGYILKNPTDGVPKTTTPFQRKHFQDRLERLWRKEEKREQQEALKRISRF